MKNEIRCGTCHYFSKFSKGKNGVCTWPEGTVLPWFMRDVDWFVLRGEGTDCELWEPARHAPGKKGGK